MMEADSRIACLKKELQDLRIERQWEKMLGEAEEEMRAVLIKDDVESLELESQNRRSRKIPRRIDERPQTNFDFLDESESLRVQFYYPLLDRIISELTARFPTELKKFSSLYPKYMGNIDAESNVKELCERYSDIDSDRAGRQWKLFTHEAPLRTSLLSVFSKVPAEFSDLRKL